LGYIFGDLFTTASSHPDQGHGSFHRIWLIEGLPDFSRHMTPNRKIVPNEHKMHQWS
jgi:hypothetical protein